MCIIAYKPKKTKMIDKKILENCFDNNPDYCGYMFADNNRVHIRKGFFSAKELLQSVKREIKDVKKTPIVFHFRIATSGKIDEKTSHPFPLSNSIKDLQARSINCACGIVHNGVINGLGNDKISDTQEFIKDYLSAFTFDEIRNLKVLKLIELSIKSDRLLIMNQDGKVLTLGKWIIKDGVFFSNDSYKKREYRGLTWLRWPSESATLNVSETCEICGEGYYLGDNIEDGICDKCYNLYFNDMKGVK